MNKCPKCGHEYPAKNQAKGGKNRWKGMTKKQRSEEMKRVRAKGTKKGTKLPKLSLTGEINKPRKQA
jgi:DNA-directed RNA polymerase subunit M/transcription elongation factor TFIIS